MNGKQRMELIQRLADIAEQAMQPKPPSPGNPKGLPASNNIAIPGGGCLKKLRPAEVKYLLTRFKSVRGPGFLGYMEFKRKRD